MSNLDRVDLRPIDANSRMAGDQAFASIGGQAFHKIAGELRFERDSFGILVQGDINGDGRSDFDLYFEGITTLSATQFFL